MSDLDPADLAAIGAQLGREPRAIHEVGHRCPCGNPDVVTTLPRLPNGTPFPTTYYLTCPRAASRIGTLEGTGTMKEMQDRLGEDPELARAYAAAHERYLAARGELARSNGQDVPEIEGISAGGMPDRVKCLHVLAGQALAQGRASTRSATRCWRRSATGGPPGPASPGTPAVADGPVAAIDCGTNTIKLLVGELPDVAVREMRMVRLGQDLDRTGRIADEALARAFTAIEEYAALIAAHGVPTSRIRFCATSASRDAANADVFTDGGPGAARGRARGRRGARGGRALLRRRGARPAHAADLAGAGRRHRRRLDRAGPRLRRRRAGGGGLDGHRVGAPARAAPALRPAHRGRGRRLRRRHRRRSSTPARSTGAAAAVVGVAGTVTTSPPACSACRPTTATRSTRRVLREGRARARRAAGRDAGGRAAGAALDASRSRRRDRRRRADLVAGAAPDGGAAVLVLRVRHPRRDRLVDRA